MAEQATIGKLAHADAERDAIHVAIAPVVAGEPLPPGTHVGFLENGKVGCCKKPIGIVDPFLDVRCVLPDQRFYLFLYPNTVTGMRHHWSHPSFVVTEARQDCSGSRAWLENFADQYHISLAELIERANAYLDHSEYWVEGDRFEGEHVPDEFWIHFAAVTGKTGEGNFFSCSC